jgi:hypothetical protein
MTFEEILDQAIAMLQRRGRMTYRTLQRQFALDDDALSDLKDELLYAHPEIRDDAGRGLIWAGAEGSVPPVTAPPVSRQNRPSLPSIPTYLAEKILRSKSALEGERKQVTVLFADLKGSTELIRDLDPEAAQRFLDPALQHMTDAVHRYEGTVNQVLGDGIMALFGAPLAHEDHAIRACYAALTMQTAMHHSMRRTCAGPMAWKSRCASASTRGRLSSGRLVTTCTWTTPPWGRRRTWRRGWNNSPRLGASG